MRFKLEDGDRAVKVVSPDLAVVVDYSDCIGIRAHSNYPEPDSVGFHWSDVPAIIEGLQAAAEQTREREGSWRAAGKPPEGTSMMTASWDQERAASDEELARAEAEPDSPEG